MNYVPHKYQEYATNRIIECPKVGLFLDMGLGKTIITLTAITQLLAQGAVKNILIIAPLRVAETTWSTEAAKWKHTKHLKISKIIGTSKNRIQALSKKADLYITNRDNVSWLVQYIKYHYDEWPFDLVVIDELSSFKNARSLRFKKLKTVLPFINRIVGLTGTPAPNGLKDLWAQIYLLDQGKRLETTYKKYINKYSLRNKAQGYKQYFDECQEKRILSAISDICVSMSADDYLTMPQLIDNIINIKLPRKARQQYNSFELDMVLSLKKNKEISVVNAVALMCKLLQVSNGAVYDENHVAQEIHKAKLNALTDIVEAANGNPLLIFYLFKHDATRITKHLESMGYPVLPLKNEQSIQEWNSGNVPIMIAHPASAGHGLNLQDGGHTVVWFGLPWSLELYQQGIARVYRQGQEKPVVVYHLVASETIDENVLSVLRNKDIRQNAVLEAVKAKLLNQDSTENIINNKPRNIISKTNITQPLKHKPQISKKNKKPRGIVYTFLEANIKINEHDEYLCKLNLEEDFRANGNSKITIYLCDYIAKYQFRDLCVKFSTLGGKYSTTCKGFVFEKNPLTKLSKVFEYQIVGTQTIGDN